MYNNLPLPNCTNPTLLINPAISRNIYRFTHIHWNTSDVPLYMLPVSLADMAAFRTFYELAKFCNANFGTPLDESPYFYNKTTGEIMTYYVYVPCNHCEICRNRYRNEWLCRCMLECQTSTESNPLFVTLTYDNEHKPAGGTLVKRHTQLFLKRLRKSLYGSAKGSLRYYLCGEYGSKTKRPHYHAILWNMPYKNITAAHDILRECWDNGFVYVRPLCGTGSAKGTIKYTLKYCLKQNTAPKGCEECFNLKSIGIGAEWLKSRITDYLNDSSKIEFTDIYSGTFQSFAQPRYIRYYLTKHKYPFNGGIVSAFHQFCHCYETLRDDNNHIELWSRLYADITTGMAHFGYYPAPLRTPTKLNHCKAYYFHVRTFVTLYETLLEVMMSKDHMPVLRSLLNDVQLQCRTRHYDPIDESIVQMNSSRIRKFTRQEMEREQL